MQRSQSGIREGVHVLEVRPAAIKAKASRTAALLRIDQRGADDHESGRSGERCFPHGFPPKVIFLDAK
jgi:hypothetical protein